ncbi:O-antigen ligase family protein [Enterovirga sp. CN4-39]|uniref:O-antigen ligase family protein n=1 Tax=Enterovirga sp. CN4-39 TaxID=3400910 RepID=UPI003C02F7B6
MSRALAPETAAAFAYAPAAEGPGWTYRPTVMTLGLVGLMTIAAMVGPAGAMRLGFPALAAVIAGLLLLKGRLSQFICFCVALFVFTPFVRRLVDIRAGWETLNLLLLAPYAAAVYALGTFAHALARGDDIPGRASFIVVIATTTFGLGSAIIQGKLLAGGYDYLRWVVPPALALLIICNRDHLRVVGDELTRLTLVVVPIVGMYGVYQFLRLPAWDAFWMQNAGLVSIGPPIPMQFRVFGTMNSPGSFSGYLMIALAILLVARSPLRWVGLAVGSLALALTLSRTAWLGFVVATAILVLAGPVRTKMSVATLVGGAILALPMLLVVPEIYNAIATRLDSFNYLSGDTSFNERSTDFLIFQEQASTLLIGQGLAVNGAYTSYAGNGPVRYIDGGPIETVTALGLVAGLMYYGAVAFLSVRALKVRPGPSGDAALCAACKAIVVTGWVLQIGGSTTIGEVGVFFWIALGILLAHIEPSRREDVQPNHGRAFGRPVEMPS